MIQQMPIEIEHDPKLLDLKLLPFEETRINSRQQKMFGESSRPTRRKEKPLFVMVEQGKKPWIEL